MSLSVAMGVRTQVTGGKFSLIMAWYDCRLNSGLWSLTSWTTTRTVPVPVNGGDPEKKNIFKIFQ